MSEEFKREVRYVVTKIKTGEQVTCVVVAEDWPEYETVWRMIQDRMEGRPNELEQLRTRKAELERQLAEANARWMADAQEATRFASIAKEQRERAELAEQRIAESQRQEPVAHTIGGQDIMWHLSKTELPPKGTKLYRVPIVLPDVEEAVKAERERLSWDGYLSSTCTSRPNGPSTIHLHFNGANKAEIAYIKLISVVEEAIRARGKT